MNSSASFLSCANISTQRLLYTAKASGRLHVPTDCLELRDLQLLPSLLAQQKFRKPEHVQALGSDRKRSSPEHDGDRRSVSSSSEGSTQSSQSSSRESSPVSKGEDGVTAEAMNGEDKLKRVKDEDQQHKINSMLKYSVPFISAIIDPKYREQQYQDEPSSSFSRHWQDGQQPISRDIISNNINYRDYEHSPNTSTTAESSDDSLRFFDRSGWSVASSSGLTVATTPSITDVAFSNCSTVVQVPSTTVVQDMEAHVLTSRELQEQTYEVFRSLDFDCGDHRISQEVLSYPPTPFAAVESSQTRPFDSKVQLWDYQGHGGLEFWWGHMGGDVVTADQIAEGDVASSCEHPTTNLQITAETVAGAEDFDIYTLMGIDKPSYETASSQDGCIYIPVVDNIVPLNPQDNPEHLVTTQPPPDMTWSNPDHTEETTMNGEQQFLMTQMKNEGLMICYDGGWVIGSDSSYGMKEGQG